MQAKNVGVSVLVLLAFCAFNSECENCDSLGVLLYEDLGCTPLGSKECPNRYRCDFIKNEEGCQFRGKYYDLGEFIEEDVVQQACGSSCRCVDTGNGTYTFNCTAVECPTDDIVTPGCFKKHQMNSCCDSDEIICPEKTVVSECRVQGDTYQEGQKFHPRGKCLKCVCSKDFKGKYEDPFCKKHVCATQLRFSEEIQGSCAPYYDAKKGEVLCCPQGFVCPNSKEEIKAVTKIYSRLKCKFGSKTLKKGEGFETEFTHFGKTTKIQCECYLPPLVTCWNKE